MNHLTENILIRYISDELSENEHIEVDTHIDCCQDCLERIQGLRILKDDFESIWDSWTADEHGRIYRQWQLMKALKEAADASPSIYQKAAQWAQQLSAGIEAGLKVLVSNAKKAAIIVAEAMPEGYQFQLRPAYAGVASEERRVLEEHLNKSSTLLSQDKTDMALGELIEAVKIDARVAQVVLSEVYYEDNLRFHVAVNSHRSIIWIKCWPLEKQEPPSLAALLPKGIAKTISIRQFKPVEGERYLLAEFENVADGAYSVAVGPLLQRK